MLPFNGTMEDLLNRATGHGCYIFHPPATLKKSDSKYLDSIAIQLNTHGSLTVKQRTLARNILKRYLPSLNQMFATDVSSVILNDVWASPIKEVSQEYSIVYDVDYKKILVRFPYNEELLKQVQQFRKEFTEQFIYNSAARIAAAWANARNNPQIKQWEFELTENSVKFLMNFAPEKFTWDHNFSQLVEQIKGIDPALEVPTLDYVDSQYTFKNTVVKSTFDSLIPALYSARQNGISHYSDQVKEQIANLSTPLLKFFSSVKSEDRLNFECFSDFSDIIKCGNMIMVSIPAVNQLLHVRSVHQKMLELGYTNDQILVMFRLDRSQLNGSEFNQYVKDHTLNGTINNQTKIVMVSERYPKPLADYNMIAKRNFDLIITFGEISPHYILRSFIQTHHNVIEFDCLLEKDNTVAVV